MKTFIGHFVARPRLLVAMAIGVATAALAPGVDGPTARALIGWDVGGGSYIAIIVTTLFRAEHGHLRRSAQAHAEGAAAVSSVIVAAAFASIAAIVLELASTKHGDAHAMSRVLIALSTVASTWVLIPTLFTMNYASVYHAGPHGEGLHFPEQGEGFEPDYTDFLYFSFTIAVAMQTADVSITSRAMRRLVLVHSLISFLFNTAIVALTVNIAASAF